MAKNKRPFLILLFIWFLVSSAGIYVRLYPLLTHRSFESNEKATVFVLGNIRTKVIKALNSQYPDMPAEEKNKLIKKNIDTIIHTQSDMVRKTIDRVAQAMDIDANIPKYPYLLASDSFYYLSLTENIINTGRISEEIKGSKYFNKLMFAPVGFWEPLNLHPYIGCVVYKAVRLVDPQAPIMYALSFTPLFIMSFALIPFILICYRLKCRYAVILFGGLVFSLSPVFIKRSSFGWYDNDPYNTFFPMLILCALFYGISANNRLKSNIITSSVCALLICIYSLFWHGWVFLLTIVMVSGVAYLIYNQFILKNKEDTKKLAFSFLIILLITFLGTSVIFGVKEFFILFKEAWVALREFGKGELSSWPSLYISVGELRSASLDVVVDMVSGIPIFVISLIGMLASIVRLFKSPKKEHSLAIITLTIFMVAVYVLTFRAQRFALLCIIPTSIFFALGLEFILQKTKELAIIKISDEVLKHNGFKAFSWLLCLVICFTFVNHRNQQVPNFLNKIYNSTWDQALKEINQKTPPESIINTWWPPGHFIKAIAKRRVTFDGATINYPQGYWMSLVFLTHDEKLAAGILRMLNNSANQAGDYLLERGFKVSEVVEILKTIVKLDHNKADQYLKSVKNLDDDETKHLLELTHSLPPPSYLLLFDELVEKNIQFKFSGGWNFKKIEEINADPELLSQVPQRNTPEFFNFLWDLAGGPYKYSGILSQLSRLGDELTFEHNVKIDLKTMNCLINSSIFGKGIPMSMLYLENGKVVEKKFNNANLPFSVVLVKENKLYKCALMDRPLAHSTLMQLYFFDGTSLDYFKPVIRTSDLTHRTEILVFEIDWDKLFEDVTK